MRRRRRKRAPMKRTATTTAPLPTEGGPQSSLDVHPGPLRRVLPLSEGRRPVHRRPPRRGRVPDRRGARPPRQHVELDRRALLAGARLRGLSRAPGRRAGGVPPARRPTAPEAAPLFSLDQSPFETALAADHANVEETARKTSRSQIDAAVEAIARAERILLVGTDQMAFFASYLRHLLMLLDLRAEVAASPVAGGARAPEPHRRADARRRPVGRPPAPAGHAGR